MMRTFTSIPAEKKNSYIDMVRFDAWRDFEMFLDNERSTALELGINSSDIKDVQVNRGKVQQIDAIKAHIGYILESN